MKYESQVGTYQGYPVFEILADGQPFGTVFPYDREFKFGLRKARAIVACLDALEEFSESEGRLPDANTGPLMYLAEGGLAVSVIKEERFIHSSGQVVNEKFLKLSSGERRLIGIGRTKARALLDLEDDLRSFCANYGRFR